MEVNASSLKQTMHIAEQRGSAIQLQIQMRIIEGKHVQMAQSALKGVVL